MTYIPAPPRKRTAHVVIGANFGDEGKGLFTDYAVRQSLRDTKTASALVVRMNGGAQAGHTVTTPDGKRHVFSHFGSGTLAGAPTFLSRYFVCNPLLFRREEAQLARYSINPRVYVDLDAPVTTPFDMMINQIVEESRGAARHGSCGVGFGETLERHQHAVFRLTIANALDIDCLHRIQRHWLPTRLRQLGINPDNLADIWQPCLKDEGIIHAYIDSAETFLAAVHPVTSGFLANWPHAIHFEGAQGLWLDEHHGWFPHVTRSSTGLTNVLTLAEDAGIEHLDVTYATRAYLTRHGAGPLPFELPAKPYEAITDMTNAPNEWQGSLRFAWLNLDLLQTAITRDLAAAKSRMHVTPQLAISCLDQVETSITWVNRLHRVHGSSDTLIGSLQNLLGFNKRPLTSYGPTFADIQEYASAKSTAAIPA